MRRFSLSKCTRRLLKLYEDLHVLAVGQHGDDNTMYAAILLALGFDLVLQLIVHLVRKYHVAQAHYRCLQGHFRISHSSKIPQ